MPKPRRRTYHNHPLKPRVDRLPTVPGVYLMKDAEGTILYVGKAVNLRARVRSYFNGSDTRSRMHRLMRELARLEVCLTRDEREALLLEARLIRQHQPRFNIALKTGARAMSIRIDTRHPFPRLDIGEAQADGARWFGPMSSTWRTERVVELLERYFQVRSCSDHELARISRPCLQYQLKRCPAPCAGYITSEAYQTRIEGVMEVLTGGQTALISALTVEMQEAADRLEFEQAAWIRDRLLALQGLHKNPPAPVEGPDRDVFGLERLADEVAISLLPVRWGRQQQTHTWYLEGVLETSDELLAGMLLQHYDAGPDIPALILLPYALPETETLQAILSERAGRPVQLLLPPDQAALDRVAQTAAAAELKGARAEGDRTARGLEDLTRRLRRSEPLLVVDWLRVDLQQGMAWRVRLTGQKRNRPNPPLSTAIVHKQYGIKHLPLHDLEATLQRLMPRLFEGGTRPDVLLVEGGHSMLKQLQRTVEALGWPLPLVGLPTEPPVLLPGLLLPGRRNKLPLPINTPARLLLEQLRELGLKDAGE